MDPQSRRLGDGADEGDGHFPDMRMEALVAVHLIRDGAKEAVSLWLKKIIERFQKTK
jgi:hypothetical protein